MEGTGRGSTNSSHQTTDYNLIRTHNWKQDKKTTGMFIFHVLLLQ